MLTNTLAVSGKSLMKIKIEIILDTDIQEDLDALHDLGQALRIGDRYDTGSEGEEESS